MKTLRETVEIYKGRKAPEVFDEPQSDTQRYLQIEDLRPDAAIKYARDADGVLANNNDVIIAWDGANAGTVSFSLAGYIGSTLAILRPKDQKVYAPFLGYFLQTKFNYLRDNTTGATIPHVNRDALEELALEFPPLPEQRRIAALLDKADHLRRTRRYAAQLSETFLQAVFVRMFGDPVTRWQKWDTVEIQDVTESLNSRRIPVEASIRLGKRGQYPYYGASGIIDYVDEYIFDEETLLVAEDGANLLARSTPIAFIASGKYWVNNHAHVLRIKDSGNILYLRELLNMTDLKAFVTGSAQPKLTAQKLVEMRIPSPPLAPQQKFARIVQQFERLRAQQREAERQVEHLFQTLLCRAFSGEV